MYPELDTYTCLDTDDIDAFTLVPLSRLTAREIYSSDGAHPIVQVRCFSFCEKLNCLQMFADQYVFDGKVAYAAMQLLVV